MKERPILFSGPMVKAILAGKKTQTRRIIKPQPFQDELQHWNWNKSRRQKLARWPRVGDLMKAMERESPYGVPGDRLWVREAFQPLWRRADRPGNWETGKGYRVSFPATDPIVEYMNADDELSSACKPSIHMPRWACRLVLKVEEIRVQWLKDITVADAQAEGRGLYKGCPDGYFVDTWDAIHGKGAFNTNPMIWAVTFSRVD